MIDMVVGTGMCRPSLRSGLRIVWIMYPAVELLG